MAVSKVPKSIKDLDDASKKDVLDWAKANYDIADDALEAKVEAALELALHSAQFVGKLLPADPPAPASA